MATATFYSTTADGSAHYSGASWPPSTPGGLRNDNYGTVGAYYFTGYHSYQTGIGFNISSMAGNIIESAVLSLRTDNVNPPYTGFTLQARGYDWGSTYTTDDFVADPPTTLGADSVVGTFDVASGWYGQADKVFTSTVNMAAWLNTYKAGTARFILTSDHWPGTPCNGSDPNYGEYVNFFCGRVNTTTYAPKLVITYSVTGRKSVGGVPTASIKSIAGVPSASIKSVGQLA